MDVIYLATDYLVPALLQCGGVVHLDKKIGMAKVEQFYKEKQLKLPRPFTLVRFLDCAELKVTYVRCDSGFFMMRGVDGQRAYEILRALDACFILLGRCANNLRDVGRLVRLNQEPERHWGIEEMIRFSPDDLHAWQLEAAFEGQYVQERDLRFAVGAVPQLLKDTRLVGALVHLGQSRFLVNGYMVGSYYHSHYKHERLAKSDSEMERDYFENRERYELGFLSAFKGIESLLGVTQLTKSIIPTKLAERFGCTDQSSQKYTRMHECFLGYQPQSDVVEMTVRFLNVRNAAAAHGNPTPPIELRAVRDSVFEIQHMLGRLCEMALGSEIEALLPDEAYCL